MEVRVQISWKMYKPQFWRIFLQNSELCSEFYKIPSSAHILKGKKYHFQIFSPSEILYIFRDSIFNEIWPRTKWSTGKDYSQNGVFTVNNTKNTTLEKTPHFYLENNKVKSIKIPLNHKKLNIL